MDFGRGGWLLILLVLGATFYDLGRPALRDEERPAQVVSVSAVTQVELRDSFGRLDGIHQINDASALLSVIKLAKLKVDTDLRRELLHSGTLENGELLEFQNVKGVLMSVDRSWMPASRRMALGIPLQVERMSLADWVDLPGCGPALAQRIVRFRQENGEIHSLDDLERVRGIGSKRLAGWRKFFYAP